MESSAAGVMVIEDPAERWHRLQLAFSQRTDAVWTGDDLMALLGLLRSLDEKVAAPDWRNQEFVAVGVEGVRRWWARVRTSRPDGLRLLVRTRGGAFGRQFLVARAGLRAWHDLEPPIERSGPRVTLKRRGPEDEIWFELARPEEFRAPGFRRLLEDLLRGFAENGR
ncbi:MAG: hypothetical protein HYU66_06425 [Armatimonadetes bacterium]|nr:hypothetical protein [Armatimonadota bacterium]